MMKQIHLNSVDNLVADAGSVGVIGYPGAGKTTFASKIPNKCIIHTDDYLEYTHDDRPVRIMEDITALKEPYVVEGNEVTRLIMRGWKPELLVLIQGSNRNEKSLHGLQGRLNKFLKDYDEIVYVVNPRRNQLVSWR